MGQDRELNQVNVLQAVLNNSEGLTSAEKRYCKEHLVEWISKDKSLNNLISKFEEISLDVRPLLKENGFLV